MKCATVVHRAALTDVMIVRCWLRRNIEQLILFAIAVVGSWHYCTNSKRASIATWPSLHDGIRAQRRRWMDVPFARNRDSPPTLCYFYR